MMRVAFIMEKGLGHTTHFANLQAAVAAAPDLDATWLPITFDGGDFLSRVPKLRNDIVLRGGVMGRNALRAALRRAGSRAPFDALFFHTQMPAVFCADIMARIPAAISLDATPRQFLAMGAAYGLTADPQGAQERRRDRWYRRAFGAARRVFPWSAWAGQSVVNDYGVAPGKVQVFPPGVDLTQWTPASEMPASGTPAPRAAREDVRVLFVGGDLKRKGGDLLLRWMAEAAPANVSLDMVTRDPVPPTPRVTVHADLTANDPRLVALYQQADVFALPTRADCFSLVAVEAMASGLPVITTRVGGISEIVRHGQTGFLLEPDDYPSLAAHLDQLVADAALRREMGRAAHARAEAHYDGPRTLACLLDSLRDMASEGTAR